jgi:multicomponent Na+:H+ antiporter subunit E
VTARPSAHEVGRSLLRQLPLLVGLVVLWMFLWNQLTVLSFVTGVLVALLVTRVFFLPPVELSGRFNLGWRASPGRPSGPEA